MLPVTFSPSFKGPGPHADGSVIYKFLSSPIFLFFPTQSSMHWNNRTLEFIWNEYFV